MIAAWISAVVLLTVILAIPYLIMPKPRNPKNREHYDYALLLGCPALSNGSLSQTQKRRLQAMEHYLKLHEIDFVVISGSAVKNHVNEADILAEALHKTYPTVTIEKEKKARNTFQNMQYTRQAYGNKHILIITSDAHLRRSYFFARKFFSNVALGSADISDSGKEYIKEYIRMWNALYWEVRLRMTHHKPL